MRLAGSENVIIAVLEALKISCTAVFLVGLRHFVSLVQSLALKNGTTLRYRNRFIGHDIERIVEFLSSLLVRNTRVEAFASGNEDVATNGSFQAYSAQGHRRARDILIYMAIFFGVLASVFDVLAFLALSTEGPDIANKQEWAKTSRTARVVNPIYNVSDIDQFTLVQPFFYVVNRLKPDLQRPGNSRKEHVLRIPLRVDFVANEKWRVNEESLGTYAVLKYRDKARMIDTYYNKSLGVVFGHDSQGLHISTQGVKRVFRVANRCSDNIGGARKLANSSYEFELCYSDGPRTTSCKNEKDGAIIPFEFYCSELTITYAQKTDKWLTALDDLERYAGLHGYQPAPRFLYLNAIRANSIHNDTSPAMLVAARLFTEVFTKYEFVENRTFYTDTTVVVIPNFIFFLMAVQAIFGLLLICVNVILNKCLHLVSTTDWPSGLLFGMLGCRSKTVWIAQTESVRGYRLKLSTTEEGWTTLEQ